MKKLQTPSTTKKYAAKRKTAAITTPVVARTCGHVGQETRRISPFTSSRYDLVCSGQLAAFVNSIVLMRPNQLCCGCHPRVRGFVFEALGRGRGIRTPKGGFGDRWFTVSLCPSNPLIGFFPA